MDAFRASLGKSSMSKGNGSIPKIPILKADFRRQNQSNGISKVSDYNDELAAKIYNFSTRFNK